MEHLFLMQGSWARLVPERLGGSGCLRGIGSLSLCRISKRSKLQALSGFSALSVTLSDMRRMSLSHEACDKSLDHQHARIYRAR